MRFDQQPRRPSVPNTGRRPAGGTPGIAPGPAMQRSAVNHAVATMLGGPAATAQTPAAQLARSKARSAPILQRVWGMDWEGPRGEAGRSPSLARATIWDEKTKYSTASKGYAFGKGGSTSDNKGGGSKGYPQSKGGSTSDNKAGGSKGYPQSKGGSTSDNKAAKTDPYGKGGSTSDNKGGGSKTASYYKVATGNPYDKDVKQNWKY